MMLLLLLCQQPLQAQARPKKEEKKGHMQTYGQQVATTLRDSLKLSAKQQEDIVAVNTTLDNEKLAVIKGTGDRTLKQQQINSIEQKRDSLYKAILKPKQYEAYLKNKAVLLKF